MISPPSPRRAVPSPRRVGVPPFASPDGRPTRPRLATRETRANGLARSHVALGPVRQWVPQLAFAFSLMSRSSAD